MATYVYQIISDLGACGGAISTQRAVPSVAQVSAKGGGASLAYVEEHYGTYARNIAGGITGAGGPTVYPPPINSEWLCYVTKSTNSVTADFSRGETVFQPQANHPSALGMTAYVSYWDPTRQILGLYDVGHTVSGATGPTGPIGSTGATGASSGWSGGQISGGSARWEISTVSRLIEPSIYATDVAREHWGACGESGGTSAIKFGSSGVFNVPFHRDPTEDYIATFNLIQANHAVRSSSDFDFMSSVTLYDSNHLGITMSTTGGGSGSQSNHGLSGESEFNDFYHNYFKQKFDTKIGSNAFDYYMSLYAGLDSVRKVNTARGL